jgi:acyl transferase domain-containing protein
MHVSFLDCSPDELANLPPEGPLLFQCAWEALDDAGYAADCPSECRSRTFFASTSSVCDPLSARALTDVLTRLGPRALAPAVSADLFLAVHAACLSVLAGECDIAVAGGLTTRRADCWDAHGRWTETADSEFLVLRRLDDAVRDGDHVYAVLVQTTSAGAYAFAASPFAATRTEGDWSGVNGAAGVIDAAHALWRAGGAPQRTCHDTPRRLVVASLRNDDTRAQIALEEMTDEASVAADRPCQVVLLSARTPAALDTMTDRLSERLGEPGAPPLADVAFTLQVGRRVFNHRRIAIGSTTSDVAEALARRDGARVFTREQPARGCRVAFLCAGLGDHYVGMARALYHHEPVFRAALDECASLALRHTRVDIRDAIYPRGSRDEPDAVSGHVDLRAMLQFDAARLEHQPLTETRVAQPAVFAVGYALACYLRQWGIEPAAVLGHSLGEYVAATVAGVFSLADAVHVVCHRANLIDRLPRGAMLAVAAPPQDVLSLLGDELDIAAVNAERAIVIAGSAGAVARAQTELAARAVACRPIRATHAFHSRMLVDAQKPLIRALQSIELHAPSVPCVSNVTGTWLTDSEATNPGYWARHMCATVRFSDGLGCLLADPHAVLLEVGPGQTLGSFAKQHPAAASRRVSSILSSVPLAELRQSDFGFFQTTLGKLWLAGVEIDWARGCAHARGKRVSLPTYPFDVPDVPSDASHREGSTRAVSPMRIEPIHKSETAGLGALE